MRGALGFCLLIAVVSVVRAEETPEPPPEAADGDYTLEARDTLDRGAMELDIGASGRNARTSRSLRRVRFRGEGAAGTLREGDDPLRGGRIETRTAGGVVRLGRLSPRWGRGLVLGGASEPWSRDASDRGEQARFVGRAGEGAAWGREAGASTELIAGRFAKRRLVGLRSVHGGVGIAALAGRGRRPQTSLALGEDALTGELAVDGHGRWRAECALLERSRGSSTSLALRAGHAGFRSLAEPLRSGPAHALSAWLAREAFDTHFTLGAAAWSFRPGEGGARAVFGAERALSARSQLALALEEQRGPRREGFPSPGPRRGLSGELHASGSGVSLAIRHEVWGERPWARLAVRRVASVRSTIELPRGTSLVVLHAAWRAVPGERLWLADPTRDGLVLRSALGAGERSRLELSVPGGGGTVRAGLTLERRERATRSPLWTAEWTKRGRL